MTMMTMMIGGMDFKSSIGNVSQETLKNYIENQGK